LAGLVDLERAAVVGHSYGGYAALAAGGARLNTAELQAACESDGRAGGALALQCDSLVPHLDELAARAGLDAVPSRDWPSWADPRVDAVVALAGDAMMFGAEGLASLTVPVLAIGGTADRDSPFEWGAGAAFEHAAATRKVQVSLQDAGHLLFAGGCAAPRLVLDLVDTAFCSDQAWDQTHAHDLVAHYTTAFLLAEVTGIREVRSLLAANDQPITPQLTYRAEGY
jgi:predicted dienelactone hydrolase